MIEFYDVKDLAIKHFYSWENGEDFDWLRKNFEKFNLSTIEEANTFIYCMGYIYSTYVSEAIKAKHTDSIMTVELYCKYEDHLTHEIQRLIEKNLIKTYQRLFDVYHYAEELYREFASISIEFAVPHQDGYKYLKSIADKYGLEKSRDINIDDFYE